jgi:hypothetical protein
VSAHERGRERLGRQVGGDLGVSDAGEEIAQHAVLMAPVKGSKGTRLATRPLKQRLVRRLAPDRFHTPYLALDRDL